MLSNYVRDWNIVNKALLRKSFRSVLLRYEYQKLFDKAVVIYINLSDPAVFEFLKKHKLHECAFENMIQLIGLDKDVSAIILHYGLADRV